MRISIVTGVFPPEPVVSAKTSHDIASALSQAGHRVEVITPFPSKPAGRLYKGYSRRLWTQATDDGGFKIVRCFSVLSRKSSLGSRFLENLSFGLVSSLRLLFSKKPDVVYANTGAIFAVGIVSIVCLFRRIPYVISIQDIYPESLVNQGRIKPGGALESILKSADSWVASRADSVVVLSREFCSIYEDTRLVPRGRVHIIRNWGAAEFLDFSAVDSGAVRSRLGIRRSSFLYVYAGNIGVAAGLETLIREVQIAGRQHDIVLLIAGDGSAVARCKDLAAATIDDRVVFRSPWPVEETAEILGCADAFVLPTLAEQAQVSVPSKLISYLFAGRPVLAVASPGSEIDEIVRESGCGWVVPDTGSGSIAKVLAAVARTDRDELTIMGRKGREFAINAFGRDRALASYCRVILLAAEQRRRGSA